MAKRAIPSLRIAPSTARLGAQPRRKGDAKRVRQAVCAKLAHQIGAVNLYRARRDAEIIGDRLVRETLRQTLQYVLFATRQRGDQNRCIGCVG